MSVKLKKVLDIYDDATKKGHPREEDRYMGGCGLRPHPHIYPSPLLEGSFFSALITEFIHKRVILRVIFIAGSYVQIKY